MFCKKNNLTDIDKAIQYFSIFGGYDITIDCSKSIEELIERHILNNYEELKAQISKYTGSYHINHAILSGIALGDRKTTSSFKKAHVSFEEGMKNIEKLIEKEIIEIEPSQNFIINSKNKDVAKKLLFTTPFLRFWFAFISPIYKGIRDKNYDEFYKNFENRKLEFPDFIIEELILDFIIELFEKTDSIKILGKYWDSNTQFDIVAKTTSEKIIIGNYLNSNKKIKKSSLNKLIQDCKDLDLKVDTFVLFSKYGYTNELKSLKSDEVRLFTIKSLKLLID